MSLCLDIKPDEDLKIGDAIIYIISPTRTRIRVAIDAPKHIRVERVKKQFTKDNFVNDDEDTNFNY